MADFALKWGGRVVALDVLPRNARDPVAQYRCPLTSGPEVVLVIRKPLQEPNDPCPKTIACLAESRGLLLPLLHQRCVAARRLGKGLYEYHQLFRTKAGPQSTEKLDEAHRRWQSQRRLATCATEKS